MPTHDVSLTLSNASFGRAEEEFQTALRQVKDYLEEHNQRLGEPKAKIAFTIEVNGIRDEPVAGQTQGDITGYRIIVQGAKVSLPARLGRAQRARKDGESVVVDQDEIDADKTRSLPFLRSVEQD